MPLAEVRHCLICEEVRHEVHRKLTILGFYGIAPDVAIRIQEAEKPLEKISFVLLFGPSEGGPQVDVSVDIRHRDGTIIPTGIGPAAMPVPRAEKAQMSIGIAAPIFPRFGEYVFSFLVDGQTHFQTTFRIERATAQDFTV